MISYDVEVMWRRDGKLFQLPATVCFDDDEGPDSAALRAQAILHGVDHNLSDFPEDIEGAELDGARVRLEQG